MFRNADQKRLFERLVVAAWLLILLVGGCSSDDGRADEPIQQSDRIEAIFDYQRAFIACLQDNGIDAELLPHGGVSPDRSVKLPQEEWRELYDRCDQRLEDDGFVLNEEPSDESRERNYNSWVMFRECMVDQGIALGELVTFEAYYADPEYLMDMITAAISEDLVAFQKAYDNCPSRIGFFGFNVVDLSE